MEVGIILQLVVKTTVRFWPSRLVTTLILFTHARPTFETRCFDILLLIVQSKISTASSLEIFRGDYILTISSARSLRGPILGQFYLFITLSYWLGRRSVNRVPLSYRQPFLPQVLLLLNSICFRLKYTAFIWTHSQFIREYTVSNSALHLRTVTIYSDVVFGFSSYIQFLKGCSVWIPYQSPLWELYNRRAD